MDVKSPKTVLVSRGRGGGWVGGDWGGLGRSAKHKHKGEVLGGSVGWVQTRQPKCLLGLLGRVVSRWVNQRRAGNRGGLPLALVNSFRTAPTFLKTNYLESVLDRFAVVNRLIRPVPLTAVADSSRSSIQQQQQQQQQKRRGPTEIERSTRTETLTLTVT